MNTGFGIITSKAVSKYAKLIEMSEIPPDCRDYSNSVYIGKSKIYKMPVMLNPESMMNPHISILGTTGSGKTHLAKNIVVGYAMRSSINVLIVDWNGEYNDVSRFLAGKIYTMGYEWGINLIDPFKNRDINESLQTLSEVAGLEDEYKNVISKIIEAAKHKIDVDYLLAAIDDYYKSDDSFLHNKVEYLSRMGVFSSNPIDINKIMRGISVLDLSRLETQEQKYVYALSILKLVSYKMYMLGPSNRLRSIIVLDEVWKFLEKSTEINKFFRESRKFGFGLVISSQLAADINKEIMGNSSCFFIFRLQEEQDIRMLSKAGIIFDEDPTKLKRGSCIMSVSLKDSDSPKIFVVEKTDGFDVNVYKIKCGSMIVSVSKDKLSRVLKNMGIEKLRQNSIELFANQNERNIDLKAMVIHMKEVGLDRPTIITILSEIGIDDLDIVMAYESSKEVIVDGE